MLHRPDSQTRDIERCGSRAVVLRPLVGRARDSPCVSPAALRFVAVMPEPVARAGGASLLGVVYVHSPVGSGADR